MHISQITYVEPVSPSSNQFPFLFIMHNHQRQTLRLQHYDYSVPGYYFVTLCTVIKKHLFGNLDDKEMRLNEWGYHANHFWRNIPDHFDNVTLDEYCIMPNHRHGIIVIHSVGNADLRSLHCLSPLPNRTKMYLSKVIHGFKSSVTRSLRRSYSNSKAEIWKKSFYEHIIRKEKDLDQIRDYMINPLKWKEDEYYA